jgi:integrase
MRIQAGGKRLEVAVGTVLTTTLVDAREKADKVRRAVANGENPRLAIKPLVANANMGLAPTVKDVWDEIWMAKEPRLSNTKSRAQWKSTMERYVLPYIGHRPVADVTPSEVIRLLKPIWNVKEETARRILQRIQTVFASAIIRQVREKANPCTGIARELGRRLKPVRHHRALPYSALPVFMVRLKSHAGHPSTRLAFDYLILMHARSDEVRRACWAEIDWDNRIWRLPAERMKSRREHEVPLSGAAIEVLREAESLHTASSFIFPGPTGRPLSDMAFNKLLRDWNVPATAHGFRTTFKLWAADNNVPDEISEAALAHCDKNRVRAAYLRTTFIDHRRDVAERWADFACRVRETCNVPAEPHMFADT